MRIAVLGAGFGGLEIASSLSAAFGDELDLVLVDRAESFVFGFSKLDVMFGRASAADVTHRYDDLAKPGVRFLHATITRIDPVTKQVETDVETLAADILVIALGADLDPTVTPGLVDGGREFYSVAGAFALQKVLADFAGGHVVVGVTSLPFKCPPAPSETALLVNDLLVARGVRDKSHVSLVMPLPAPIPPSPQASAAVLAAFESRGIVWRPNRLVREVDHERGQLLLTEGEQMPYDLFLAVPQHHAPQVVVDAGLTQDGWIAVEPATLETAFPAVYAVGDVTSVGTPKAGVFAEGQAAVVAQRIAATLREVEPTATYDGNGICYLEFGGGEVATVDVTFRPGEAPTGTMHGPSADLVRDKTQFGTSRIARWFGPA